MPTLATTPLPPGLVWTDEFEPSTVTQSARRTLSGSLVIYHAAQQAGRPITLQSEPDSGWATLATVQALQALAAVPGATYTLSLRGTDYQVMFAHHNPPALQASPLFAIANPGPTHPHLITLRLITV